MLCIGIFSLLLFYFSGKRNTDEQGLYHTTKLLFAKELRQQYTFIGCHFSWHESVIIPHYYVFVVWLDKATTTSMNVDLTDADVQVDYR